MSRITNVLLVSAVALGLSACSSSPVKNEPVAECEYPGSSKAAPLWVCHVPPEGIPVSAVGSHGKSAAGYQFMTDMAAASARKELATNAKLYVAGMVKKHLETTGVGDAETVDAVASATTKQITDGTLVGSRILKTATAPDGTLYVLVGMDSLVAEKVTANAVKTSMNNDRALWQKFQGAKAQDEMAADIAKQRADFDKQKQ